MRLIDAEELIEHAEVNCESKDFIRKLMDYVADAPTIEPEPHWIPCSERLPEDNTSVLVTFSCGKVGTSSWHKDTKYNNGFDMYLRGFSEDSDDVQVFGVIAWKPLPEPYGGEEE